MNYANVKFPDIANGPGCRVSLFVSGCTHHCKECFNSETWDFSYGKEFDDAAKAGIMDLLDHEYITGLTVLGGEPMEIRNQKALLPFLKEVRESYPELNIWIYSGYTFEELIDETNARCHSEDTIQILELINTLVDGRFHEEEKDMTLKFRGSKNQRIINVRESLKLNSVVKEMS